MSFPRNKPPRFAGARRWLVACCLLIPWPGFAAQQLTFSLERLTGEGFALRDVAFAVDLFSGALQGRVARLDAPASDLHWKDISLDCPQGELTPTRIGCRAGSLRFTSARLGRVSGEASFDYGSPFVAATHRYGFRDWATGEAHLEAEPDRREYAHAPPPCRAACRRACCPAR